MKIKSQENLPEVKSISHEEITWTISCHLSGLAGFLFPLGNILIPLFIWILKRRQFPYLHQQGKEAVNFQITVTIYYLISIILVLRFIGLLFLLAVLAIFQVTSMIIACIKDARGEQFKYPITIRFL